VDALFILSVIALSLAGCGVSHRPGQNAKTSPATMTTPAKAPPISEESNALDIAAYVNYYKSKGFVITSNKQTFDADGQVLSFQFAASKRTGASSEAASATINSATHTVSTSSSSASSTANGS